MELNITSIEQLGGVKIKKVLNMERIEEICREGMGKKVDWLKMWSSESKGSYTRTAKINIREPLNFADSIERVRVQVTDYNLSHPRIEIECSDVDFNPIAKRIADSFDTLYRNENSDASIKLKLVM